MINFIPLCRYPDDKHGVHDSGFNTTLNLTKNNNLLANLPEKRDPMKTNIAITKNSVLTKCKKIYL